MKKHLKQAAPKASKIFVRDLEQKLRHAFPETENDFIFNLNTMKRRSFVWMSGVLVLALATGIFYPFSKSPEDYIASAKEYYDNYSFDGILYQKQEITFPSGVIRYNETWENLDGTQHLLIMTRGDGTEQVSSIDMSLIDEYGNRYEYSSAPQSQYGYTVNASYCVIRELSETGSYETFQAFETSPEFLKSYQDEPQDLAHYYETPEMAHEMYTPVIKTYVYVDQFGIKYPSQEQLMISHEDQYPQTEVAAAFEQAMSTPETAKLLFEAIEDSEAYEYEIKETEDGSKEHIFTVSDSIFSSSPAAEDSMDSLKFAFNEDYGLVSISHFYGDFMLFETKYLDYRILDESEAEQIFDPEQYDLSLVSFTHPLKTLDLSQDFQCFNFANQPLSIEETEAFELQFSTVIGDYRAQMQEDILYEEQALAWELMYAIFQDGNLQPVYENFTSKAFQEQFDLEAFKAKFGSFGFEYFEAYQDISPLNSEVGMYVSGSGHNLGDTQLNVVGHFVLEEGLWKLDAIFLGEDAEPYMPQ